MLYIYGAPPVPTLFVLLLVLVFTVFCTGGRVAYIYKHTYTELYEWMHKRLYGKGMSKPISWEHMISSMSQPSQAHFFARLNSGTISAQKRSSSVPLW